MGHTTIARSLKPPPPEAVVLPASDTPTAYWHLMYRDPTQPGWDTYLAVNQTAIAPVVLENAQHCLFVGVEQGVFALATQTGTVVSAIVDTSYVQWIEQASHGVVLVPAEDELLAFAPEGTLLWRKTFPDVIDSLQETDGLLEITDVATDTYCVELTTGAPFSSV
jgi:hypothetical protein